MNERAWSNLNVCGLEISTERLKLNILAAEMMGYISHNFLVFPKEQDSGQDILQFNFVTCYDEMLEDDKVDTDIIHNLDTFLVCIDGVVASLTIMIHCDITTNISDTIITNISFLHRTFSTNTKYSFTPKYQVK